MSTFFKRNIADMICKRYNNNATEKKTNHAKHTQLFRKQQLFKLKCVANSYSYRVFLTKSMRTCKQILAFFTENAYVECRKRFKLTPQNTEQWTPIQMKQN